MCIAMDNIYDNPEHELLREQVARFIAREVEPSCGRLGRTGLCAARRAAPDGDAGLLGLMYESERRRATPMR